MYRPVKCQCGDSICKHWHVDPVAAFQGVSFTEEQAIAVASLLNGMKAAAELRLTLDRLSEQIERRREEQECDIPF